MYFWFISMDKSMEKLQGGSVIESRHQKDQQKKEKAEEKIHLWGSNNVS